MRMSFRPTLLIFALAAILLFQIRGSAEQDKERGQLRMLMHFFYSKIAEIRPLLVSEKKFRDPKAQKELKQALDELVRKTEGAAASETIEKAPGFRITYSILADHFKNTQKVFEHGETENARLRLSGTTNFCVSCHTQVPDKRNSFGFGGGDEALDKVTFENAEFQFITRRFDHALDKFDQLVRGYPKSGLSSDELAQVYRRKIAIFARVKRDPGMALNDLKKDLENKKLPLDIQQNIKSWLAFFTAWKAETHDPANLSDEELIHYAERNVSADADRKIAPADPEMVKYLRISGLLYERLMKNPEGPRVPDMLLYLGICERNVSNIYWYSLNDIYWKECVVKFPKASVAKRCFDAYEGSLRARYNGTPPEWVRDSIKALSERL